ncbi:diacylglycerol kinase [Roseibium aquae]|uniref:Diacylglycerol kinase n=1 Tax=Roseibium aquae TaxID=1323746 RepID=A0A916TKV1_9HYPH|nr:c-type cytochrome [Roseibium aquae]GGB50501.1 diacylglycerol kinase [Roseibium aquae]
MKKLIVAFAILGAAGFGGAWVLSAPQVVSTEALAALTPGDAVNGERLFWAGGCASCHAAPEAKGEDKLVLAGGVRLESPFGTFVAPNISMSESAGIGAWSLPEFVNAMVKGTAPDGANYYPAFPYTSYTHMTLQDVADLFAFMTTLPAVETVPGNHELGFPFNIRRTVGLWKRLYLRPDFAISQPEAGDADPALWERGRYLVEGPGHCAECHTPRGPLGGLETGRWMAGAPNPAGEGRIPDITPSDAGIGGWSVSDIAYYLESGFTPDYDSVGGEMVAVQENMTRLPAQDREAIAVYLKALPPSN